MSPVPKIVPRISGISFGLSQSQTLEENDDIIKIMRSAEYNSCSVADERLSPKSSNDIQSPGSLMEKCVESKTLQVIFTNFLYRNLIFDRL